jgi:hypothetical protein
VAESLREHALDIPAIPASVGELPLEFAGQLRFI